MRKTIGILAHVDAGKTTFSEQLLYHAGVIRQAGRVDSCNTLMDSNSIEKQRGITIFSGLASFPYGEDTYYLIDTPGHVDFCAEMERSLPILDYAILLIGGMAGIQSHTVTLLRLLQQYSIPVFFFLNKEDQRGFDLKHLMQELQFRLEAMAEEKELAPRLLLCDSSLSYEQILEESAEAAAEADEHFLEQYLEEDYSLKDVESSIIHSIQNRLLFPVFHGSALKDQGVQEFFHLFHKWTVTSYEQHCLDTFSADVYQVRHDVHGNRITFLKASAGKLDVKTSFSFLQKTPAGEERAEEKVNELRLYHGDRYTAVPSVQAGDVFAVTGFKAPLCGSHIFDRSIDFQGKYSLIPALKAMVTVTDGTDIHRVLSCFRQLEAEDPALTVTCADNGNDICLNVMGTIQLEVLTQLMQDQFQVSVTFQPPNIQYRETIAAPVMGYGHFEPLRHYAEVHVLLEPGPKGSGITFESRCHVDWLSLNYQNLIRTHVFEKTHKGILTGSPLTDVKVILTAGRAHLKHTEGGDFREATYRAIRQGLEKARNILLEPYYTFEIQVPSGCTGRVLSDLAKMSAAFSAPLSVGDQSLIRGRAPVSELLGYPKDLASFSRGEGSISLTPSGYEPCHNSEDVITKIGYDKGADTDNSSCSVFCSHGTSFVVNWDEAERYMHCVISK